MALVDLLRRRRLAVAAALGAVVGALVGLFLPIRAADPPKAEEAAWALPNAQALKRFSGSTFQTLKNAQFWGDLAGPGKRAKAQQSNWVLTGIVTRPRVQVSVAENGKPAQTWVRIGGTLPDGSTLDTVSRDRIWFSKDGCRRVRSLYQDKTHPDPGACLDANGRPLAPAADAPPVRPAGSPAGAAPASSSP